MGPVLGDRLQENILLASHMVVDRFVLRVDLCRSITLAVDHTENCKLWYADFKPVLRGSEYV